MQLMYDAARWLGGQSAAPPVLRREGGLRSVTQPLRAGLTRAAPSGLREDFDTVRSGTQRSRAGLNCGAPSALYEAQRRSKRVQKEDPPSKNEDGARRIGLS